MLSLSVIIAIAANKLEQWYAYIHLFEYSISYDPVLEIIWMGTHNMCNYIV
jgi:hypothetical protein